MQFDGKPCVFKRPPELKKSARYCFSVTLAFDPDCGLPLGGGFKADLYFDIEPSPEIDQPKLIAVISDSTSIVSDRPNYWKVGLTYWSIADVLRLEGDFTARLKPSEVT